MLGWRIISGLVGIPLMLGVFYLGGIYATVFVLAIAVVAVIELLDLFERQGLTLSLPLTILCTALLIFAVHFKQSVAFYFTLCVLLVLIYQLIVLSKSALSLAGAHLLAIFYVGWLLSYAIRLEQQNYLLVFWVLVINWSSDILAYAVGLMWGKHQLAPKISPKKTIEGGVGAIGGAVLGAVCFWYWFFPESPVVLPLLLGLVLGVGGQVGDLCESHLKRTAGVKDSGTLIPGHGGVLDRFDSLLFNLPLMYYLIQFYNFWQLGKPL